MSAEGDLSCGGWSCASLVTSREAGSAGTYLILPNDRRFPALWLRAADGAPPRDSVWETALTAQGVRPGPCFSIGLEFIAGGNSRRFMRGRGREQLPVIAGVGVTNLPTKIRGTELMLVDKARRNLSEEP